MRRRTLGLGIGVVLQAAAFTTLVAETDLLRCKRGRTDDAPASCHSQPSEAWIGTNVEGVNG